MAKTKRTNNDLQNRKLKTEQHKPHQQFFGEGDDLVLVLFLGRYPNI